MTHTAFVDRLLLDSVSKRLAPFLWAVWQSSPCAGLWVLYEVPQMAQQGPPNGWQITPNQPLGGHFTDHLPAMGVSWKLVFICLSQSKENRHAGRAD